MLCVHASVHVMPNVCPSLINGFMQILPGASLIASSAQNFNQMLSVCQRAFVRVRVCVERGFFVMHGPIEYR